MWVALHLLLWDGRVNTSGDLDASLRSPGEQSIADNNVISSDVLMLTPSCA